MRRTIALMTLTLGIGILVGVMLMTYARVGGAGTTASLRPLVHQSESHLGPLPGTSITASPSTTPSAPEPAQPQAPAEVVVARLSIPALGLKDVAIYDRGTDSRGSMAIAHGFAVTHFQYSAGFGAGNTVLYGHDDIEGSVFARLKDLNPGNEIDITLPGAATQVFRVTGKKVIAPTEVQILAPTSDVRLTLFTCWPNLVDTQRIVVTAAPA